MAEQGMANPKRYHVYAIAFDMEGHTEGDLDDFRRNLGKMEVDFDGVHLLGVDWTYTWPTYSIRESVPSKVPKG